MSGELLSFEIDRPPIEVPSDDGITHRYVPGPHTYTTIRLRIGDDVLTIEATDAVITKRPPPCPECGHHAGRHSEACSQEDV